MCVFILYYTAYNYTVVDISERFPGIRTVNIPILSEIYLVFYYCSGGRMDEENRSLLPKIPGIYQSYLVSSRLYLSRYNARILSMPIFAERFREVKILSGPYPNKCGSKKLYSSPRLHLVLLATL